MNINKLIESKRIEFETISSDLHFLESIVLPLKVNVNHKGFKLYCDDYSLASNFKIKKLVEHESGFNCYDGGYYTEKYSLYPQFYFTLKRDSKEVPVLIQHKDFDKDDRIIFKSYSITKGNGVYKNENNYENHYVNIDKVYSFFEEKGVKKDLINSLQEKIEELRKLGI